MTTTTYMLIPLPNVDGDRNEWGAILNAALQIIDGHNHDSVGKNITPSAIDINADLTFASNNGTNLRTIRLDSQGAPLALPSDLRCLYVVGSDLYYNNGSGTAVKITNGSGINASGITLNTYETTNLAGNLTISAADTFYCILVNTTSARSITMPAANSVAAGRHYIIKDISGQSATNNISIIMNGSDSIEGVAATKALATNWGSWDIISDGTSKWYIL